MFYLDTSAAVASITQEEHSERIWNLARSQCRRADPLQRLGGYRGFQRAFDQGSHRRIHTRTARYGMERLAPLPRHQPRRYRRRARSFRDCRSLLRSTRSRPSGRRRAPSGDRTKRRTIACHARSNHGRRGAPTRDRHRADLSCAARPHHRFFPSSTVTGQSAASKSSSSRALIAIRRVFPSQLPSFWKSGLSA